LFGGWGCGDWAPLHHRVQVSTQGWLTSLCVKPQHSTLGVFCPGDGPPKSELGVRFLSGGSSTNQCHEGMEQFLDSTVLHQVCHTTMSVAPSHPCTSAPGSSSAPPLFPALAPSSPLSCRSPTVMPAAPLLPSPLPELKVLVNAFLSTLQIHLLVFVVAINHVVLGAVSVVERGTHVKWRIPTPRGACLQEPVRCCCVRCSMCLFVGGCALSFFKPPACLYVPVALWSRGPGDTTPGAELGPIRPVPCDPNPRGAPEGPLHKLHGARLLPITLSINQSVPQCPHPPAPTKAHHLGTGPGSAFRKCLEAITSVEVGGGGTSHVSTLGHAVPGGSYHLWSSSSHTYRALPLLAA
jgi:hypothetical protein